MYDLVYVALIANAAVLLESGFECEHSSDAHSGNHSSILPLRSVDGSHESSCVGVWGLPCWMESLLVFCVFTHTALRTWLYEVGYHARLDGGEDIMGRFLFFFQVWCASGMAAHIGAGLNATSVKDAKVRVCNDRCSGLEVATLI